MNTPEVVSHPLAAQLEIIMRRADDARRGSRRDGLVERPLGNKARRTRNVLLQAAWDTFVEHGYRQSTVTHIHERAGVSLGTFYQYFRDKSDVMTTLVGHAVVAVADSMFRRLDIGDELSDDHSAAAVLEGFVRHYVESASFQRVWEEATHLEPALARFRYDISEALEASLRHSIITAQRAGTADLDLPPAATARALAAMVDRTCYLTFVVDARSDESALRETIDVLVALWTKALQPPFNPPPSRQESSCATS